MTDFDKAMAALEAVAADAIPVVSAINPAYGAMATASNLALRLLVEAAEKIEHAHQAPLSEASNG
jgi:hypothetical protein